MTALSEEAIQFRRLIIDATWSSETFGYVDRDCYVGKCPRCDAALGVHFARKAPKAIVTCFGQIPCTEAEVAASLGMSVR